MHKDDHDIEQDDDRDIENSDGRRCNNKTTNESRLFAACASYLEPIINPFNEKQLLVLCHTGLYILGNNKVFLDGNQSYEI